MSIFNSLGSNYNFNFVIKKLFSSNDKSYQSKLIGLLEDRYGGKVTLVYKGREAIRLTLKSINLKGSSVAICGFTCFAVWEAITREGYDVEYLDIEKDSPNFSAETLKVAINKNPKIKVVMIQNTLGYPCDIEEIAEICKKNNLILIEDLAHSIGAKYKNGEEAGTVGDFTIFSFSQDKMIDNVSGGALVIRNNKFPISNLKLPLMNRGQVIKDRIYPIITFNIRKIYSIGVGKVLHKFSKAANILSKPMNYSDYENIHTLPIEYCKQIYQQFLSFTRNQEHKAKIAGIYSSILDKTLISKKITQEIDKSSNLRFPIFAKDRNSLINFLKKEQIFISDIWYDAPISPKKYLQKTDYKKGLCPNSEYVSEIIVNLPTHININESDAKKIAERINLWLISQ